MKTVARDVRVCEKSCTPRHVTTLTSYFLIAFHTIKLKNKNHVSNVFLIIFLNTLFDIHDEQVNVLL